MTADRARPLLLVTNDDGIAAHGLWDLVRAVAGLGDVAVVAPAREQSWTGRAHRSDPDETGTDPVTAVVSREVAAPEDVEPACCHAVAATPARCVRLALDGLGLRPAVVLSGINSGSNVGALVSASGTLGAAWEAAGDLLPAVAFSRPERMDRTQVPVMLAHVRSVVGRVLSDGLPAGAAVLNVNFPSEVAADAPWTTTTTSGTSLYGHRMTPGPQDDGTTRWALDFLLHEVAHVEPGSDLEALRDGSVSLTFLPSRQGLTATW
ncbi:MAG: 5'/3'-nucleotidase SurE [Actinobacteria bacterium]|nr:5'/3'-nucleotidase SurE [Actinomycetota bacterium]